MCIYDNISLNSFQNEKFLDKSCVKYDNKHFMFRNCTKVQNRLLFRESVKHVLSKREESIDIKILGLCFLLEHPFIFL